MRLKNCGSSFAIKCESAQGEASTISWDRGCVITCGIYSGLFSTPWFLMQGPLEPSFVLWSQQVHQGIVSGRRVTSAFQSAAPSCQHLVRGHNIFLHFQEIVEHSESAK